MAKEKFAFIIIPPGQESWNFKISTFVIWILAGIFFLMFVIFIGSVVSLGYLAQQVQTVERLNRENQNLLSEHAKIGVLEDELSHSKSKLNKILALMGADSTSTGSQADNLSVGILASGTNVTNRNVDEMNLQFSSHELINVYKQSQDARRAMPSIWPTKGIISQSFIWKDGFGKRHPGIDIATAEGSAVVAAADGQVVMADWDNALGFTVMINHRNGYTTLYGHNSRLLVSNGVTVKRGQTVALSGNTGRSSAPHLHYEVRKNGTPQDPGRFITN